MTKPRQEPCGHTQAFDWPVEWGCEKCLARHRIHGAEIARQALRPMHPQDTTPEGPRPSDRRGS